MRDRFFHPPGEYRHVARADRPHGILPCDHHRRGCGLATGSPIPEVFLKGASVRWAYGGGAGVFVFEDALVGIPAAARAGGMKVVAVADDRIRRRNWGEADRGGAAVG